MGAAAGDGRSRKPRLTLERKIIWECHSRGDGGFYSWQSGKEVRDLIGRDVSSFDSDEMSPLYENRCSHWELSSNATVPIT